MIFEHIYINQFPIFTPQYQKLKIKIKKLNTIHTHTHVSG